MLRSRFKSNHFSNFRLWVRCLPLWLALGQPAFAADTTWNGGTRAWSDIANWSNGVPTGSGITFINNGGTAQLPVGVTGTYRSLRVGTLADSSKVEIGGGTLSGFTGILGYDQGSSGTATVTGGSWTNSGDFYVGASGNGSFLLSGGQVSNENAYLAANPGSTGHAVVSGGTWSTPGEFFVGYDGAGTLDLTDTGTVSVGSGSGTLILGANTGTGVLNLGTGGAVGTLQVASVTTGGGTGTVNFNHTGTFTFAPQLTGTLSVNKLGAGTTFLTGNNSYAGGTTITGGILNFAAPANLGTGAITLNGGTLQWATGNTADISSRLSTGTTGGTLDTNGNAVTFASAVGGSGGLTKIGTGTLTLTASNAYTGGTTVRQGTLAVVGGTISHAAAPLIVGRQSGDNATITITNSSSVSTSTATIGRDAGSTGSVTVTDSTFTATGGIIDVGLNGNGSLTVTNSTLSGSSYIGRNTGSVGTVTMNSGTWTSGSSQVGYAGTGSLILNGGTRRGLFSAIGVAAGGYGTVTVNGGTFRNNYLTIGGYGTGNLLINGGLVTGLYFYMGDSATGTGYATMTGGTWNAEYIAVGLSGAGHLLIDGGTVTDDGADIGSYGLPSSATVTSGTWTHTTSFSVAGGSSLWVNGGTVTSGSAYIGWGSATPARVTVSSGSLIVNDGFHVGFADTQGSVEVTDSGVVTLGADTGTLTLGDEANGRGTLNIGTGGAAGTLQAATVTTGGGTGTVNFHHTGTTTFAPQLTGELSVNKLGAGTTILTGHNTYSGATTLTAGKLVVNGALTQSAVTVQSGATLGGSGTVGALTLNTGATLAPGNSPGTLTVNSDAVWNGGATYVWEINDAASPATSAGTNYDLVSISGTLTLNATTENPFTLSLVSLLANNTAGDVLNFNAGVNSAYVIASAAGGIIGFDANAFTINPTGFTNALAGGSWSLALANSNKDLQLNFTAAAIPEPSTYAAMFGAAALALAAWRNRSRRAK